MPPLILRFLPTFTSYLQRLQEAGVIPLVVFDGQKLPAKADENMRRRRYFIVYIYYMYLCHL